MRHVGILRSGRGCCRASALALAARRRIGAPSARRRVPRRAAGVRAAGCPWFFAERLRFRIAAVGAGGMTVRALAAARRCSRARSSTSSCTCRSSACSAAAGALTAVRRERRSASSGSSRRASCSKALSHYLLAADETLTPAALRAGGLAVGSIERAVTYDYATTSADTSEILALRLLAHQAEGHLDGATIEDMRSPFDAHSRHLTCRFGGRIVGYVRVIFVDGDPARSQYVSLGGHEVPQWLWDAGFVEAARAPCTRTSSAPASTSPLMQHVFRVAVQSGHRYVLGACPDELVACTATWASTCSRSGSSSRSPAGASARTCIYADAERLAPRAARVADRRRHGVRRSSSPACGRCVRRSTWPPSSRPRRAAQRHDLPAGLARRRRAGSPGAARLAATRASWSSTSWARSSSSSSAAASPRAELRARGARASRGVLGGREPARFGTWVVLSVEPPARARAARAAAPRAAPGPQPLRDHADEQGRLAGLRVAVAGLSVGRAVVSTLVHEGIGGELRLADFDVLDLSNLNRVAGGVADVGVEQGRAGGARGRRARSLHPRRRVPAAASRTTTIGEFVGGRRRDRRRVRRPGDEGARCASTRAPPGGRS